FLIALISPLQLFVAEAARFVDPALYYHVVIGLLGFPFALMIVLYNAVISDVIDYDETVTGFRREAMYYGMEGFFTKTARGAGSALAVSLFWLFGHEAGKYFGLLLAGPACAVFALLGALVFSRYTLGEGK
ncbi:MAG: MFS transporter, partial [bacterium]